MRLIRNGLVQINERTIELPEADARALFLAASAMTKRTGALAIDKNTVVTINSATQIALTITEGFVDEYNPHAALAEATRGRVAHVA
jgi:hypothetical protein